MRWGAKLDEWQAAGLVDAGTAAAILAHEDRHRRPVALLAVAGLGVLALVLGIVSVVAANWDGLPAWLKLSVHFVLTLAAAGAAWRWARSGPAWAGEVALLLLAGLTLAGIALQAQVYQQTGPLWQALAWWAVLVSPAVLLLGQTRLAAAGYGTMLIALAFAAVTDEVGWVADTLAAALPAGLVVAALALPAGDRRASFALGLLELGLALALVAACAAQFVWSEDLSASDVAWTWRRAPLAVLLVAGGCLLAWRRLPRPDALVVATVLAGAALVVLLACAVPHGDEPVWRFLGLASYAALWGGVATVALRAGWSRLFGLAVVALAVRLFVVYIELFYSLAFTGVGLIVGGLLLIGLTWGATRIVRNAKP